MSFVFTLICTIAFLIQEQHLETRLPDSTTPVELYSNQTNYNLKTAFTDAIDSAEKSILLIIYSLTDPEIIEHLKFQSENGVHVKVISDAKASPYLDTKLGDRVDVTRRFGPGLMHQKILVVDSEKVWLGSANMTSESLQMHGNLITALNCKEFANRIHQKADTLKIEGKSSPIEKETFRIGEQDIELWFLPDNPKAVLEIKNLIRSAQKTIRIAMFTWTRFDLAKAVIEASKRGVDTEVVIDRNQGKGAGAAIVKLLKDNKINVTLSTSAGLLHHKFLYIDNHLLVNGSANWTKHAFTQNDDCFIIIHDLSKEQNKQMEILWDVIRNESAPP